MGVARTTIWLMVLMFVAFAMRTSAFTHGLPYVEHLDEPNAYRLANDWRGVLGAGWRGEWLAGYPPGYMLFSGTLLNGMDAIELADIDTDMPAYIAIMRYTNILLDLFTWALLIRIAFWLGGRQYGRTSALATAIIYGLSYGAVQKTPLAIPDPLSVYAVVQTAFLCVLAIQRNHPIWAFYATLTALCAVIIKYPLFGALLMPAMIFLWLWARTSWRIRTRTFGFAFLAGVLVICVAYILVFVLGGTSVDNHETRNLRDNGMANILSPAHWQMAWYGLGVHWGLPAFVIGLIGWVIIGRKRLTAVHPASIILGASALVMYVFLVAYIRVDFLSIRYGWASAALGTVLLGIGVGVVWHHLRQRWQKFIPIIPMLLGIPMIAGITYNQQMSLPHTYAEAQYWFEQNTADQSSVWVMHEASFRSLSRYDGGYSGFNAYETRLSSETDPDASVDYVYSAVRHFNDGRFPRGFDLSQNLLLKEIGDNERLRGDILRIYEATPPPTLHQVKFANEETSILLYGARVQTDDGLLQVKTYWQAPDTPPAVNYSWGVYVATQTSGRLQIVAQYNGQLVAHRPTSQWHDAEEIIVSAWHHIPLSDLPDDTYQVLIAVYDSNNGQRLVLPDGNTLYALTTID